MLNLEPLLPSLKNLLSLINHLERTEKWKPIVQGESIQEKVQQFKGALSTSPFYYVARLKDALFTTGDPNGARVASRAPNQLLRGLSLPSEIAEVAPNSLDAARLALTNTKSFVGSSLDSNKLVQFDSTGDVILLTHPNGSRVTVIPDER